MSDDLILHHAELYNYLIIYHNVIIIEINAHNKCDALVSSWNHSPVPVMETVVCAAGPWCQRGWDCSYKWLKYLRAWASGDNCEQQDTDMPQTNGHFWCSGSKSRVLHTILYTAPPRGWTGPEAMPRAQPTNPPPTVAPHKGPRRPSREQNGHYVPWKPQNIAVRNEGILK